MLKRCIIIIALIMHCPLSFKLAGNVKDMVILSFRRAILLHILSRGSTQPFRRAILLYFLSGGPYVYTSYPQDYTSIHPFRKALLLDILSVGPYFYTSSPEGYTSTHQHLEAMKSVTINVCVCVCLCLCW